MEKPYAGPKKHVEVNALGRNVNGKAPWINWTKDELDLRAKYRAEAEKAREPILAQIKIAYPSLMPDPA